MELTLHYDHTSSLLKVAFRVFRAYAVVFHAHEETMIVLSMTEDSHQLVLH